MPGFIAGRLGVFVYMLIFSGMRWSLLRALIQFKQHIIKTRSSASKGFRLVLVGTLFWYCFSGFLYLIDLFCSSLASIAFLTGRIQLHRSCMILRFIYNRIEFSFVICSFETWDLSSQKDVLARCDSFSCFLLLVV